MKQSSVRMVLKWSLGKVEKNMWKMAIHNNMMDAPDFNRVWLGRGLGYLRIFWGIWFSFILYAVIYAIIVGYLIKREISVS